MNSVIANTPIYHVKTQDMGLRGSLEYAEGLLS